MQNNRITKMLKQYFKLFSKEIYLEETRERNALITIS